MKNKIIWIIGCSHGIGKQLSIKLDSLGAKLILSSRDKDSLQLLNKSLNDRHYISPIDVSNDETIEYSLNEIYDNFERIDIIIHMAAIYKQNDDNYNYKFARELVNTNIGGAISLTYQAIPRLLAQKTNSQLVLCASVAGYLGLPLGQTYSCSKAALINFAESLHAELYSSNVKIRIINPGFVKTRLTDKNDFSMPFIINSDKAAEYIAMELGKNNFEIHFPKIFTRILKFICLLPYPIIFFITKKLKKH